MSEKRDQIVAAALKLFCQKGFQSTSTAAISKEAGVATGTLFLYFKSKEELINALYSETKNALAAHVQQDFPSEAAVADQLHHYWQKGAHWALENPFHYRFSSMFSNSPFITKLTRDEAASSFQFMQDLVEKGIQEGSLVPIDRDLFISLFSGHLYATVSYLDQHSTQIKRQEVLAQAFHTFINGVAAS